jgi:large subunit ribosomal protein L22
LAADLIRGRNVKDAEKRLAFTRKRSVEPLMKLLKSVVSNASHNYKKNIDSLYVKEIKVDEGPILKRYIPKARGRATMIRKRTSHVQIVLDEQLEQDSKIRNRSIVKTSKRRQQKSK